MSTINDLKLLEPAFLVKVEKARSACAARGIVMVSFETIRTPHLQAKYYRQGRTRTQVEQAIDNLEKWGAPWLASVLENVGPQTGKRITGALPGQSWHHFGRAIDCYWDADPKPGLQLNWDVNAKVNGLNGWRVWAEEATRAGLVAAGPWFGDWPHVQDTKQSKPPYSWPELDRLMKARFG